MERCAFWIADRIVKWRAGSNVTMLPVFVEELVRCAGSSVRRAAEKWAWKQILNKKLEFRI